MWVTQFIELGRIKENSKQYIVFRYEDGIDEDFKIESMKSSCGCSTPKQEKFGVSIEYKAGPVPPQLETVGEYTTTKRISLVTNKGNFTLEFKATVYK